MIRYQYEYSRAKMLLEFLKCKTVNILNEVADYHYFVRLVSFPFTHIIAIKLIVIIEI